MIYRPRRLVAEPASLAAFNSPAAKERQAALLHYGAAKQPTKNMTFDVYSRDDVKQALEQLFGEKCAYCEYDYSPGMPVDIEHYRPKGGVIDADGNLLFPGYWWLASEWTNLLPACADCNRRRWHRVEDDEYKFGKENLFPLPHGTTPARTPAALAREQPLLINPAEENPADHLRYVYKATRRGRMESVVEPLLKADGQIDERGLSSRDTYGLNRPGLVRSRVKKIEGFKLALDGVETHFKNAAYEANPDRKAMHKAEGREALRKVILHYMHWRSEYAATCRAYYRDWVSALRARLPAP